MNYRAPVLLALAGCFTAHTKVVAATPAASPTKFAQTVPNTASPPGKAPRGMVWITGGEFSMGGADDSSSSSPASCCESGAVADAQPVHRVYVDGFWMDATDVTNAQFERFVDAIGYITVAERAPTKEEFPTAPLENLVAGSLVFTPPAFPVPLTNHYLWWRYQHGANWRHPEGPQSDIKGRENYPVVQIAYEDALAYAKWAGKRLPTEAEWEFAARGGLAGKRYVWGDEFRPGGKFMANTWQGDFPVRDSGEDGFTGLAPVRSFPPNGYGLYDMAGNVWQWCSDWYRPDYYNLLASTSTVTRNPQGPDASFDPLEPTEKKRVLRGGSFLCNDQYCSRYVMGTRGKGEINSAANHIGFRCVMSPRNISNRKTNTVVASHSVGKTNN